MSWIVDYIDSFRTRILHGPERVRAVCNFRPFEFLGKSAIFFCLPIAPAPSRLRLTLFFSSACVHACLLACVRVLQNTGSEGILEGLVLLPSAAFAVADFSSRTCGLTKETSRGWPTHE